MDDNIDPSMRKVKAAVDGMHGKMMSRVRNGMQGWLAGERGLGCGLD